MSFSPARSRTIRRRVLATAVACCFSPLLASANPVGPVVTHGQAAFNAQGKLLTVTNSPGAIINWQGFSIGAGETTRFVQQSAASAVLNRVVGGQSSSILGALQSNGRVFLINPNGIIFGAGAQIDTAGLIASTLNIMDADFLSGKLRFGQTPDAKAITNAGEIRTPAGGRVMLISPEGVTNTGVIHAPNGEVILAAGKTVELTDSANPEVRVEVAAPEAKAINLGRIVAESGKVGIYGGLVANHGTVNANSAVVGENGKIVFRATKDATLEAGSVTTANGTSGGSVEVSSGGTTLVAGDVQAKGSAGAGGDVKILGERVGVIGSASIDASGAAGGGTVLVGGDLQGANTAVQNAKQTYVGADTRLAADALTAGDGGKVIVWADETTRSYGSISARGGSTAGNGGFVETSGKGGLDVRSGPDVRAPAGRAGTWLLDPVDFEVVAGSELNTTINSGAPFFAPLTDSSRIGVDVINAQLNFGSNVVLTTASRGTSPGTQQGNLTISAPIVKSAQTELGGPVIGTTTLTLQAHNNIIITPTGSITSTGDPLSVNLTANSDNSGGGAITIGGAITTRGANFFASASDAININAPISTINAAGTGGSSVQVTSQAGAITAAGAISGGSISLSGAGGVTVSQPIAATSSINLNASNGTTTVGANLTSANSSVSLQASSGIKITNGSQIVTSQFGSFSAQVVGASGTGSQDIDAGSSVTAYSTSLYADNMEIQGAVNAGNGGMSVGVYNSGRTMDLGSNSAGKLSLTQTELSNLKTSSNLYIYGDGATTVSAPIAFTQPNYIYISSSDLTSNAGASLTSASQMYLQANNSMTFGAPVSAPMLYLYAGGAITQNAGANFTATQDLTVYGSGLTLNGASSGGNVFLTGNTMTVGGTVASGSNIDVMPRDSVAVNLGVSTKGAGSLDLTAAELNRFTPAAGSGVLKIGSTGSDLLTIQGPIAPSGTQMLVLESGSGITQAPGAVITIPTLGIRSYENVTLDKHNVVGTLSAELYSSNSSMNFTNAAGSPLTIGDIPSASMSGVYAYGGNTAVTLSADAMTIGSSVYSGSGTITLQPTTSTLKVDLGGADVAGTALGLSASDIGQISGAKLLVKADKVDITAPVEAFTSALAIAPLTQVAGPAPRGLSIISGVKSGPDLELTNTDIANVTAAELMLGDATTGAITVQAAVNVPSTIGTLAFNTGNQTTGVTVNAAMTSDTSYKFITDALSLNASVSTTAGSILITTSTAGRPIELGGRTPGALGLSTFEIENYLGAPAGTLTFGSAAVGNIDVTSALDLSNAVQFRDLTLLSGGTITVGSDWSIMTPGSITLNAPRITLDGNLHSADFGNLSLTADRMDINASINAQNTSSTVGAGEIRIQPRTARLITLGSDDLAVGSNLGLTHTEVQNLYAQSVVRIGDAVNTRSIQIDAAANNDIVPNAPVLRLVGGPSNINNSITQTGAGIIEVAALAATARNNITLDQSNDIDTIAAATSSTGNINVTYSGSNPFNIGVVDGLSGLRAASGDIRVRTNEININAPIVAGFGSRNVTIVPLSANVDAKLGAKFGGVLSMDATELNRIAAGKLTVGDTTNTGDIYVSGAVAFTGGPDGVVNNLDLLNQATKMTSVTDILTVPGSVTINTGTLSVAAGITSQFGSVTASADTMTFTAPLAAASGNITLQPRTPGYLISVGGADIPSTMLGLNTTDLGNLTYGGTLTIGSSSAGSMDVAYAGPSLANNVALSSGQTVTISSAFGVAGSLNITANSMDVGGNISGNNGVFVTTNGGRSIVLGSNPGGAALELDTVELGRIGTGANGTLSFDTTGTLTTTAPLTFTSGTTLALGAGSFDNSGGTLTGPKDVTLRVNSANVASNVVSAGGGRLLVTPRLSSSRAINLGTNAGGSALELDAAEIARLVTSGSGAVQFGDTSSTGAISVTQAISQPTGSSALVLATNGSLTQSPGAAITADKLRVQSSGVTNLSESNNVNTLAGTSSGTFSFSNGIPLTIGTVDGQPGISDSNVTLRANTLDIAAPINGTTVTLAPLTGGTQVSLGAETAGQLSITDFEIDQVNATTLNIGTAAAPNATGNINVSGSVDRGFGNLNLVTGAGNTVTVNAPVGSATTSSVQVNAGAGGTANINAAVLASGAVTVNADTISTTQQITSNSGSINLANIGNTGSIALGGVLDAFTSVSATGKTIMVNAPITARRNTGSINLLAPVGSTDSSVTINNQLTVGSTINITTDAIAINAPLVTLNSTISLQPRTSGTPINIGNADPSGSFNLTPSELALLDTDILNIGNSSAGAIGINAPITSSTIQQLSLTSNSDITQTSNAPITLSYTAPNNQTGFVEPAATLNVVSTTGKVDLAADNNINKAVTGQAGGSQQNFVFKNLSPLKLQNVSAEIGLAPTGKALFNVPVGNFVPVNPASLQEQLALDAALAAILQAGETQKNADKNADEKKEEGEQKDREERKKEGKKSCS